MSIKVERVVEVAQRHRACHRTSPRGDVLAVTVEHTMTVTLTTSVMVGEDPLLETASTAPDVAAAGGTRIAPAPARTRRPPQRRVPGRNQTS